MVITFAVPPFPFRMKIEIKKLTTEDLLKPVCIDDRFLVRSVLSIRTVDDGFKYSIVEVPPYEKKYDGKVDNLLDWADYSNFPERVMYIALVDGQIVGLAAAKINWNQMAYLEDIKVGQDYRRQGIGWRLMDNIKEWAVAQRMIGIMLETQNNNVDACQFYERYGFLLGGMDKYLYRGVENHGEETALFWYLLFK